MKKKNAFYEKFEDAVASDQYIIPVGKENVVGIAFKIYSLAVEQRFAKYRFELQKEKEKIAVGPRFSAQLRLLIRLLIEKKT